MTDPVPYNPLDRANLARSVELTLLQQPCLSLPLEDRFNGAGLYAIYYTGSLDLYKPIASPQCEVPIYVGKADPPGARRGLIKRDRRLGPVLFNRIGQHSASIQAAKNLNAEDFLCRYLVVEDIFIPLGEQLLIQQFRPLWNVHVAGFGIHEPGKGRHGSERSEWDELHPGRPWHGKMVPVKTPAEVRAKIRAAFKAGDTATVAALPASAPPTATAEVPEAPET